MNKYTIKTKEKEQHSRPGQVIGQRKESAGLYNKQLAFGFKLHTDGYSAFFEKGKITTPLRARLFHFEVGERKHPKERKLVPAGAGTLPTRYVYGKINNFYFAKASYSLQRIVGNKGSKNGVAISVIYGGGLSAGLMKPYYLKVGSSRIIADVRYNNNDDVFLYNPQQVYGASGFTRGFGEIKITPGASIKTALRFDYAHYNSILSALEVGINAEIYSRKMQQMLLVENKQLFVNTYAALVFGKRK